ncbi:unnamed protein product [Paramecium primaurelia]|uniref:Uncharacterized protein n=1 Tax=Paramecium primaurelia TaxID=5886 RepID=A0A8S1QAI2_PARPR|nr:unnamed protein product [Paramecium primaurelia]
MQQLNQKFQQYFIESELQCSHQIFVILSNYLKCETREEAQIFQGEQIT